MKKEDNKAVPLSLLPPPIAAATVARPHRPPHIMRVFSRFSPKKVPLEDTTDTVVVEAEAAARRRRRRAEVGRQQDMKACMGGMGGQERCWRGIIAPI